MFGFHGNGLLKGYFYEILSENYVIFVYCQFFIRSELKINIDSHKHIFSQFLSI